MESGVDVVDHEEFGNTEALNKEESPSQCNFEEHLALDRLMRLERQHDEDRRAPRWLRVRASSFTFNADHRAAGEQSLFECKSSVVVIDH